MYLEFAFFFFLSFSFLSFLLTASSFFFVASRQEGELFYRWGFVTGREANVRVRVRVRARAKYFVSAIMSLSANLFERISFESLISYFSEMVAAEI